MWEIAVACAALVLVEKLTAQVADRELEHHLRGVTSFRVIPLLPLNYILNFLVTSLGWQLVNRDGHCFAT